MLDQFGRSIEYVRVSVTDRCNLRCTYCMPEEGVRQIPHTQILTYDELLRLIRIFVGLGIAKVKLTGGEPLVRKGLAGLVRGISGIPGITSVTLTTNGIELKNQIKELCEAGIRSVNVSLDTLDADMFRKITRRDGFAQVWGGLMETLKYPTVHLKVNCVPLRGVNESQWAALAGLSKTFPIDVRFIEMMPIGLGRDYYGGTQEEILKALVREYGRPETVSGNFGNGPGAYVQFAGFKGKTGFISAITHKFCGSCNRVRLTAEGFLKACLQYADGVDLRGLLRGGAPDGEIEEAVKTLIYQKPAGHHFTEQKEDNFEQKEMFKIGG